MIEKFRAQTRFSERVGHRLQADLRSGAVFAQELPRGNARTGHPPLLGNECAAHAANLGGTTEGIFASFVPNVGDERRFLLSASQQTISEIGGIIYAREDGSRTA